MQQEKWTAHFEFPCVQPSYSLQLAKSGYEQPSIIPENVSIFMLSHLSSSKPTMANKDNVVDMIDGKLSL